MLPEGCCHEVESPRLVAPLRVFLMTLFQAVQPVGCRACGGTANDIAILAQCREEITTLRNGKLDPKLPPVQASIYSDRLMSLMKKVKTGSLTFGDPKGAEARVIESSRALYELRPLVEGMLFRPARKPRLYCAEPLGQPKLVLFALLATKPAGPDVAHEQQTSIREAESRLEVWAGGEAKRTAGLL